MASIPFLSVLFALTFGESQLGRFTSGFVYLLYTPVMFINGAYIARKRKKLLENQGA